MTIVFNEENHSYTINGKAVKSVTQIVKMVLGNQYSNVPPEVLNKASEYGTKIHKLIEEHNELEEVNLEELDMYERNAIKQYFLIKDFDVKDKEILLGYKELYAGTCDGVGDKIIYDIKTTRNLNKDYLSLQLSLYLLAYDEENYSDYKAYCLWIPKEKVGQKVEIELYKKDRLQKEVIALLELIK